LIWGRSLLSRRLGGSGLDNPGLRRWSVLHRRRRFEFLLRRRGLLSRWLGGSGLDDPWRGSRSMMDLRRWRIDFLLRRHWSRSRWPGRWGMDDPRLRSRRRHDLRRCLGLLLPRRGLRDWWLGSRRPDNLGCRSRSLLDLWRWRFDFLLRRRWCVHPGSRLGNARGLGVGRRHWCGLGRGDLWRRCFYLRSRFRRCHVGRHARWR
jgi:hypothetical protein